MAKETLVPVEFYFGTSNRQWEILTIDLPEDLIEMDMIAAATKELSRCGYTDVAFVGVYHVGEAEESDIEVVEDE